MPVDGRLESPILDKAPVNKRQKGDMRQHLDKAMSDSNRQGLSVATSSEMGNDNLPPWSRRRVVDSGSPKAMLHHFHCEGSSSRSLAKLHGEGKLRGDSNLQSG